MKTVITILKIIFVAFITLLKSVTSRYKIIPVSNGMVPFLQLFNSDFRDDTFEVSLSTAETYFVTVLWSETEPERMTELTSNTLRCFLFLLRKVDLSFSIAEAFATDDINSSCVVLLLLRRCLSLAQHVDLLSLVLKFGERASRPDHYQTRSLSFDVFPRYAAFCRSVASAMPLSG